MLFSLLFSDPLLFGVLLIAIVTALSFHEFAHAAVAYWLGDPTADRAGRMTLNPLVHLDPVGFFMLLLVGFGYARPVPYSPAYLRYPKRDAVLIGLAGPFSNILFASVFAIVLKYVGSSLGPENLLVGFCYFGAIINVNLAVFNLIPVPPLDGSKLILALLSGPQWYAARVFIERQGPFLLLALILLDSIGNVGIFGRIFDVVSGTFFRLWGI